MKTKQIKLSTGICTYYDVGKADNTLIIIHGFSLKLGVTPIVNHLKSDFRVIVPDLPFVSDNKFSKNHTLVNYKDFIFELINKLKLKKISLFGNSLGGTIALLCSLKNPEKLDNVIIRSPFFSRGQLPFKWGNRILLTLYKILTLNPKALSWFGKQFFNTNAKLSLQKDIDQKLFNKIREQQKNLNLLVAREFIFNLVEVEILNKMPNIINKTLILWGGNDQLLKSNKAHELHKLIKKSKLIIDKYGYHNLATIDPKVIARNIIDFCSENEN